ncbi:MAG: PIG-L deacetylase family protein [bacterium]
MKKIVLVIAPHPDDDTIGCGGSIRKYLIKGITVFVVYVTNGAAGTKKFRISEFTKIRKEETLMATTRMGLKKNNLFFLDYKSWEIDEKKLRFDLLKIIRKIRPTICYIPSSDEHFDHQLVNQAALDAINIAPGRWWREYGSTNDKTMSPPTILEYEVAKPIGEPNYFEDITDLFLSKRMALSDHKSQNIKKYMKLIEAIGSLRGESLGSNKKAEAFKVVALREELI